ncbi:effector-associated constant component EACC1 [Actinokineospora sp. HUAS TT18]|uniref:effector-associated constant component EACC1 n=1 Tax=Actinokineospora sp. HUAS TT18 TaxID=3447451 RepID=UPI003F51C007
MGEARLRVEGVHADEMILDGLTSALHDDLRALSTVVVRRADSGPAPANSKSGPATSISDLLVTGLGPAVVLGVYRTIVAYLNRAKARSVTWIQDGREVTLTALSDSAQQKVIEQLAAQEPREKPQD